jgi:hypothetical protein
VFKLNESLYKDALNPILKNLIRAAYASGASTGNDNLKFSAKHMAMFLYDDPRIPDAEKIEEDTDTKADPERQRFEQERARFYGQIEERFKDDIHRSAERILRKEVERGLDPEKSMTPALREMLIGSILSEIGDSLTNDPSHMSYMNSMWQRARKAGLSEDWKPRVLSAYLGRARNLLPTIRSRRRSEVLGKSAVENNGDKPEAKKHIPSSGGLPKGAPLDKKSLKGLTDLEIIQRASSR